MTTSSPLLLCAFALHRGRFCTLPYRHDGAPRATSDLPCDRCVFIPTPDGKCICREVADVDGN